MKVSAVTPKPTTRKETYGKEVRMLTKRKRDMHDQLPRVWRAAIYLCIDGTEEMEPLDGVPSIDRQRVLCRCATTVLHAEVVGEFVDYQLVGPSRSGLRRMLELADKDPRLDYLIVASLDRLAADPDEAFEIAWRLGFAGTVVIPVNAVDEFPWTESRS
jgi:Resolvase, N terminal domain